MGRVGDVVTFSDDNPGIVVDFPATWDFFLPLAVAAIDIERRSFLAPMVVDVLGHIFCHLRVQTL